MNNDRFGAVMLAAGVLVTALVVGLLYWYQVHLYRDTVRIQGVAMVRALSVVDMSRLVPAAGGTSLLTTLTSVQRSDAFAYAVVVSKAGDKLFEVDSPGTILPAASMPTEPASWYGEQNRVSPGDARTVREFYGPILSRGELEGFVRVGYYDTPRFLPAAEISYIAAMALPVFLLAALSMVMVKRVIRPLAALGERIDQAEAAFGGAAPHAGQGVELRQFTQRFDAFMSFVENRGREMQQQRLDAQTSGRLLSYKQEKTEAVLNAVPDGVLVVDENCIPTFANQKAAPLLGVSQDELIGKEPEAWCRNPEVLAFLQKIRAAGGSALQAGHLEYTPEGQSDRRIEVATYPLFSPRDRDTLFGLLLVLRDVSQQYFVRQAGADFVSRVSHELKTPLGTLLAYSELLQDFGSLDDKQRVEAVNVIHDEAERASALIQNLLNISRLESGTMPIARHRVKVQDLLNDAVDMMRLRAKSTNVSLELKMAGNLSPARLDKDLFRIAVDNLIGNAIKYSNPGGVVTVRAEELGADELEIAVIDQGIGITPENCARVFDKYFRAADEAVQARGGHGLGLYLARQIIGLHNGTLSVTSEPGKGSRFTIQLPLQQTRLEKAAVA